MIIDIIVILKLYLFCYSIDNGVHIRYPCPNTYTLWYNTDTLYIPLDKLYIIDEPIR